MSLLTLNDIFFAVVERDARMVMMYRKTTGWASISSREFYQSVGGVARALREWKISAGDRIAILSENRPEWAMADFAALLLGVVVVPVYYIAVPSVGYIICKRPASEITVITLC